MPPLELSPVTCHIAESLGISEDIWTPVVKEEVGQPRKCTETTDTCELVCRKFFSWVDRGEKEKKEKRGEVYDAPPCIETHSCDLRTFLLRNLEDKEEVISGYCWKNRGTECFGFGTG